MSEQTTGFGLHPDLAENVEAEATRPAAPRRDPLLPSRPHRDASGAEEWGEDREREEGKGGREREIQMWERDSEGGALGPHVTVMKKNRPLTPKLTVECKIIIGNRGGPFFF